MNTRPSNKPELTRVKAKCQITLPARVRRLLTIEEGDILEASVEDGTIVLRPKQMFDRDSVQAGIAEGLADLKAGRVYGPYKNMKEYSKARHAHRVP